MQLSPALMFKKMAVEDRVRVAKEKTERVVDHLLYLLALHENNAIIVYSPTLSSQIPTSYAANAFNLFQRGLHQFEIVRLCALWDTSEAEKENIPTVIELIDHPDVIEALAAETLSQWTNIGGVIANPSSDPELAALEKSALQRSNREFGEEQAQKGRAALQRAIVESRTILTSPKLQGIMNLRDKYLAHSLSHSRREKSGPIAPMKYGDEREVLNASVPIVESLYCWINGRGFSFEDSRQIARKNANALWTRCKFDIVK